MFTASGIFRCSSVGPADLMEVGLFQRDKLHSVLQIIWQRRQRRIHFLIHLGGAKFVNSRCGLVVDLRAYFNRKFSFGIDFGIELLIDSLASLENHGGVVLRSCIFTTGPTLHIAPVAPNGCSGAICAGPPSLCCACAKRTYGRFPFWVLSNNNGGEFRILHTQPLADKNPMALHVSEPSREAR